MHRRRRCSELPLRPSVSLRRSLWLVDPAAPHLVNGPAPRIPKGVHRQAVGFKASLDHAVIIRGRQCRLAAIRLRHDIDHDWDLCASRVFNRHGFFRVVAGIPFIAVQRLFTLRCELPHQSVNNAAFFRRNGSKAAAAEPQFVVLQPDRPHDLGIRTALRHLLQIKVAAVGKIQVFLHVTPPASSERQSVPDDGAGLPPVSPHRHPAADSPSPWCA